MIPRPRRRRSLAAGLLLALATVGSAFGDDSPDQPFDLKALTEERADTAARYTVSEVTGKRFTKAIEMLEVEDYAGARAKLESLHFGRLNVYERALAYRLLAYAAFGQEDLAAAAGYFEEAVAQQSLPIPEEAAVRFNIAQLYASLQQWKKSIAALKEWFRWVEEPNPLAYYLLAVAHYQLDEFDEAIGPARRAVELSPEPREAWLQLLAALHLQKSDYDAAVPVLEELVTRFPKKDYWVQLSLIYGARGANAESLAVQQLAYTQGLLTEDVDLRRLARTYLHHELPFSAAQVLERGLSEGSIEADPEVLELLGNCWISAREFEKAVDPLRHAAELSGDGRIYMRLAQVRVQREEWRDATQMIELALDKGGLESRGKAQLLLGISYFSDGHPEQARAAFARARDDDATRAQAEAWLQHIARGGTG